MVEELKLNKITLPKCYIDIIIDFVHLVDKDIGLNENPLIDDHDIWGIISDLEYRAESGKND